MGSQVVQVPMWACRDPMMVTTAGGETAGTEGAADIGEDGSGWGQGAETADRDRSVMQRAQQDDVGPGLAVRG